MSMDTDTGAGPSGLKRKRNDTIVDPDTKQEIQDPKRPRMTLNNDKKVKCLKALAFSYNRMIGMLVGIMYPVKTPPDPAAAKLELAKLKTEVILASQITSIIFTAHNVNRQKVKGANTNMQTKAGTTDYNIHFMGVDYSVPRAEINKIWLEETKKEGLEYKNFSMDSEENWYGTMGPYLHMFAAFKLRMDELRLGHGTMPITKKDGTHTSFQVSKYGLTGAHHILLEGSSFPPERRSSIVQSLGPMTAFLCMVRTEGMYRNKFAAAVKRAMSHIPAIDDIIELTKNVKMPFELSTLVSLIAEILLITTPRQATRMCFPLNFLAVTLEPMKIEDQNNFLKFFNTTGSGGWLLYKSCMTKTWSMQGSMTEEIASQILYHSIFATYKEDLSILSQITRTGNWYTREEMGKSFRNITGGSATILRPPIQVVYAKMSCANQTGLLSGVYNQVSCLPCFSGPRIQNFGEDFFDHIEKRRVIGSGRKSLQQIITGLTTTLEEVHLQLRKDGGRIKMDTAAWRSIDSLGVGEPGEELSLEIVRSGKMSMGRNKK